MELSRLLRRRGLAARKADNSRHHILLMKSLLKEGKFTMSRKRCRESHYQFLSYYWDPKKNRVTKEQYHTRTAPDHHADTHDARRYALVRLIGYSEKTGTRVVTRIGGSRRKKAV